MYILFEIKHFQAEKCMNSAKLRILGGKVHESDQFTHFWAKKRVNPAKSLRISNIFLHRRVCSVCVVLQVGWKVMG